MKQFSLEEYLKNPNRKVITRDGKSVRIICTDFHNINYPIIIEIEGLDEPLPATREGRHISLAVENRFDLFFTLEKHEGWINLYYSGVERTTDGDIVYGTEQDAKRNVHDYLNYIETIKIEWEE